MTANIDNKLRKAIYRRDGFRCALCDSTDGLQIHHVEPRGRGGSRTNPHNLITLCWRCHAAAHGSVMFLDDYAAVAAVTEHMTVDQAIAALQEHMELACIEYVSDYYAEQGEIWYPL